MLRWLLVILLAARVAVADGRLGLESLARADRWDRILPVAVQRQSQLPLRPEEALIAAHAARLAGDSEAQANFLEQVIEVPEIGAVARVELADLVLAEDPSRALELVLDLLTRAPSKQLRESALDIAERAVALGVESAPRSRLEAAVPTIGRSSRRGIELALAVTAEPVDRARLGRLLAASTADLPALSAATKLEGMDGLTAIERWKVAQAYYRHGLYDRAAPILEALDGVVSPLVPRSEVAYLRGRCAFRGGDWSGAITWYRKAISRTAPGERQADLEVHLGRSYELADELDEAVAAAQRAVRLKTTDDRRLFLARLRLRRSEPELAQAGLARLRSRSNQARGELMLGLYELRTGEEERGRRRLGLVSRDPWRGPATVVAAQSALAAGQPSSALELLVAAAPALDPYWAGEARRIMGRLEPEVVDRWRHLEAAALDDPNEGVRRHSLVRALQLEPDPPRVAELRSRAAAATELEGEPEVPSFPPGLADRLWSIGLASAAVRWDPSGLPRSSARETWWTAGTELEHGRPWLAIGVADAARRQAAPDLPVRGLPVSLRRALYPLPGDRVVRDAAARNGVPWSLLAGVAREESRWNPTVISSVGARGLMQLMPATAAAIGTANRRPTIRPDDLFEPFISLDLGAAELSRLVTRFHGNRAAAVAAYNAGEAQAQLWLDQCGGDCSEARYLATVSFSVTRSYTEAVLSSADMYEELYGTPDRVLVTARSE